MSRPSTATEARNVAAIVLLAAFLFNFVSRGIADSFLVFMLAFEEEFGWSHASLSGVYSIYLLTVGVSAPLSGTLLDRFGPRLTYLFGCGSLAAALLAASTISSLPGAYLALGTGTGIACSALGMVPAAALIGRWFEGHISTALAIAYAGFGSGILLMVPLAQLSIETIGWRETYRAAALALALAMPLVALMPWRRIARGRPAELAVPTPSLSAMEERPHDASGLEPTGTTAPPHDGNVHAGWTLGSAIRTRPFWMLVQVFLFTAAGMHAVIVQTVAYLVSIGYRPIEAATAFGTAGMLSIAGVLATGWLSDRFGFRLTALASFAGSLIGVGALAAASFATVPALLLTYVAFFGLSQGARGPIVSALTNRHFRNGPVGVIFGLIFMLMSFGSAAGAFASGLLHARTGSYLPTFAFAAIALAIASLPFIAPKGLGR
jgi:MFS family permease